MAVSPIFKQWAKPEGLSPVEKMAAWMEYQFLFGDLGMTAEREQAYFKDLCDLGDDMGNDG